MSPLFLHGSIAWATLALVSIPIIIHLIHRRRFTQLDWAAMEFLLEALKRARRRLRLEQLLLLLVRIAAVLLAGFAIARPIASEGGLSWLASFFGSEEHVIVLDDSFSTSRGEAGRTAFARAADAVSAQIRRLAERSGSSRLTVVRASRPRAPIFRSAFASREELAELAASVGRLSPTDTRMPLAQVLEEIAERSAREAEGGKPRAKTISIVTDFRAADWTDARGGPDGELRAALARLSEEAGAEIAVLDVGSDDERNVAILGASVEGGRAIQEIPAEIRVSVKNFGPTTARGLGLRLRYAPAPATGADEAGFVAVPGPPLGDLGPGETKAATISATFRAAGNYGAFVELAGAGDALPGDDAFALSVEVASALEVLVVSGEPSSERFEGEADFLAEALAPEGAVSGIRPHVVAEDAIPRGDLDPYVAIFLLNVHSVPEEFLAPLAAYVRRGGSLAVFLGDQVDAGFYNRRLGPPAAGGSSSPEAGAETSGLLPARIGRAVSVREEPLGIAFDFDHPYFEILRGVEEWVGTVRFGERFELEPAPAARAIARFSDGSPAVVEGAVERGRAILFASAADLEGNDWPRNPTYLMVLQKLVAALARARGEMPQPLAGAPLVIPAEVGRFVTEARLRPPGFP
ncbi:MAG: BatA domain-containing protein, partial [Planctomycetota bacterium]